ncbi:MAG: hypothetical protein WA144_13370 [Candidatus Methanoperedens sp.]
MPTVEEELVTKKEEFDDLIKKINASSEEKTKLKAQIDKLEYKVKDVKKVFDPINLQLENIQTEISIIENIKKEKEIIVNTLKADVKQKISEEIESVDEYIKNLKNDEIKLLKKITEINKQITKDDEDRKKIQTAYDSIKNYQKTYDGNLKDFKELKTALQKDENPKILNFLFEEKKRIKYLFTWEDVSDGNIGELLDSLKQNVGIDWAKNAEVTCDNDTTIKISKDENTFLLMKLDDVKVSLEIDGITDEFDAKQEKGKTRIYLKYDSGEMIKTNLYKIQADLESAKTLLDKKGLELKTERGNLESITKEKDAKIKSRKADIINKIKQI